MDDWRQWRGPRFGLENIGYAWTWITREMAVWPVMALVYFGLSMVANLPFSIPSILEPPHLSAYHGDIWAALPWRVHSLPVVLFQYGGDFVVSWFLFPLVAGIEMAALRRLRGEQVTVAQMFELGGAYWPLVGLGMFVQTINMVAMAMCFLPALFVSPLLMLAPLLVLDKGLSPWEALKLSASTAAGQYWTAFGFAFIVGLASALGVFVCCVGLVFSMPILWLATTIAYNEFFPRSIPRFEAPRA